MNCQLNVKLQIIVTRLVPLYWGIYFQLKGTYVWECQPIVISSWEE